MRICTLRGVAMRVIGVLQLKGGVGRTTVATNLAVGLGEGVVLVDADLPQGTASAWGAIREADAPFVLPVANHHQLVDTLDGLTGYRYAVVDAPPRIAEVTRALLIVSDLVIVPVGASIADLWAAQDLLETVKEAKKEKRNLKVRLLWNKHRLFTKSARTMQKAVKAELAVPALKTTLGYRVAYSDALAEGLSVLEYRDRKAKSEMQNLVKEVKRLALYIV